MLFLARKIAIFQENFNENCISKNSYTLNFSDFSRTLRMSAGYISNIKLLPWYMLIYIEEENDFYDHSARYLDEFYVLSARGLDTWVFETDR